MLVIFMYLCVDRRICILYIVPVRAHKSINTCIIYLHPNTVKQNVLTMSECKLFRLLNADATKAGNK